MEIYVIVPLLSLDGALLGAYLGSYLKRKGVNSGTDGTFTSISACCPALPI